jgi:hypothetical protein
MNPDEVNGVFDVIDTEEHVAPTPAETKPETKTETKTQTNTKSEEEVTPDEEQGTDTQDFSRETETPTEPETPEPAEPSQTETKTEPEPVNDDWKLTLPPPPPAFAIPAPTPDEDGNISPEAYTEYVTEKAKAEMRQENYLQQVENRALDEAEKILPELKTNPLVRTMLQNTRVAQVVNGQEGDAVSAAREIRALLGEAKASGANNAKTQITITKNAQVETPNNQTKPQPSKADKLDKRLKAGDDSAFAELFEIMAEEGKLG